MRISHNHSAYNATARSIAQRRRFALGRRPADHGKLLGARMPVATMTRYHFLSWRACRRSLSQTVLIIAALFSAPFAYGVGSWAPDGAAVTSGYGNSVAIYGVGAYWDSLCVCAPLKQYGFDTRLVAQLAYWHGREQPTQRSSLWDVSLTPILRWIAPQTGPIRVFVEAGIGAHLLSATRINNERQFGSSFQFGEQGGGGFAFGPHGRYEFGVYIQHLSNGHIKQPNDGLTYIAGVLRVAFQ